MKNDADAIALAQSQADTPIEVLQAFAALRFQSRWIPLELALLT
jgi:hypothetical protein